MDRVVRFRVLDGIAVVTLDQPPVNALSAPVRVGLWDVFNRIDSNDDIKAAVLTASGPTFSAGADIREFAQTPAVSPAQPLNAPSLAHLCSKIEDCSKPVVAALHGRALGGGAELAFAAHYRLAAADARIGLPEVTLGLVPGAGGTQRLPRLVGAELALRLIISTQSLDAGAALRVGLLDALVEEDLTSGVVSYAQNLLAQGKGPRPTRGLRHKMADGRAYLAAVSQTRRALAGNPLFAPHRAVDCIEAAALLPFDAGMAFEADAFARCLAHAQSVALRHVFSAERRIDGALMARDGAAFHPVAPMGKAAVARLRKAMQAAADHLHDHEAVPQTAIDAAMLGYGFRKGPYGGREGGADGAQASLIAVKITAALMREGAVMVEQGAVERASDIDALAVHGLGFPRRMGGPMRACQTDGLLHLRNLMRAWSEHSDLWAVPDLLDRAVKLAEGFDAVVSPERPRPRHTSTR